MNTLTPAMNELKNFLEAAEDKVLNDTQHQMFRDLYVAARIEQRVLNLVN